MMRVTLLLLYVGNAIAWCSYPEAQKPIFPLGVLGPFTLQQFHIILTNILSAKLDFESASPIITTDAHGRTLNSSCFGIELQLSDEGGNKDRARNNALQLSLGSECLAAGSGNSSDGRRAVIGLVGGQVPSNCADSAQITTAFRIPQVAWGCAMELTGSTEYFTRTHQMDFPLAFVKLFEEMSWRRVTVVWESAETFSHFNFDMLQQGFAANNVTIHEALLERLPDGSPDYTSWLRALTSVGAYHVRLVWRARTVASAMATVELTARHTSARNVRTAVGSC
jgi:hypothetical protein